MVKNDATHEEATYRANDAIDRWDNEGGSPAELVSQAVVERVSALTPLERQIVQCLGAAVVIGWNDLPSDAQRTLFKMATIDGECNLGIELSARLARFLHVHKNQAARGGSKSP